MKTRDVAIVGYGTAGQSLAVLLSRDGHRVQVFEQASNPGPVGAGFLLQPSGLQALWQMQLHTALLAHGVPVRRLYGETPCGRPVMDMRYAQLDSRLFGLGTQRGALFSLLDQAWDSDRQLHAATRIVAVDDEGRRVRDRDGRWHGPFDLVIATDGSASVLRDHVQGLRLDRPYPWGALWCLLPADGWPHADELRQRYLAARKMIGLLPVGTRPGDTTPRLSFFWSLPCSDFERWEQGGMPAWLAEVAELWPQARERLQAVAGPAKLARASYRDAVMRRWYRGRLVLAGDAAHSMSPQLGQGVNMALMDAIAMRDALRGQDNLEAALQCYQTQRQAHVSIYQFWSRWLTPLFQSDRDLVAKARDVLFQPLGRLPVGRGHMLRVLSGTQRGILGKLALDPAFVHELHRGQ